MSKKDFFNEDTFIGEAQDELVITKNANIINKGRPILEAHGKSKLLSNKAFGIGRDRHNAVIIGDSNVSKYHATITFTKGIAYLRDINSSNGTFVNGEKIKSNKDYRLSNKDEIIVGKTKIRYYC